MFNNLFYTNVLIFGGILCIRTENAGLTTVQARKKDTSEEMSCLVDYTDKFSNFLEDLAKLDAYSQSVENDIDALINKK